MGKKSDETMTTQGLKQSIRQRILSEREQLSAGLRAQYSDAIVRRIVQIPEYQTARVVLGYMNFGAEFESELWVRQALADGKQLLLPKVNGVTNELDVYRVTDLQRDLAPGLWNIREPLPERCAKVDVLEEVDFILLPGVAFGRDGARLGYGGGYYDKLLMKLLAIRLGEQTTLAESLVIARLDQNCGVAHSLALVAGAYSMQLVEGIPQEATDRKVQWIVTENETIDCSRG
jgi:5-formyltetrahydrofolate cyclo-ligase